jgi:hypothetical protein
MTFVEFKIQSCEFGIETLTKVNLDIFYCKIKLYFKYLINQNLNQHILSIFDVNQQSILDKLSKYEEIY